MMSSDDTEDDFHQGKTALDLVDEDEMDLESDDELDSEETPKAGEAGEEVAALDELAEEELELLAEEEETDPPIDEAAELRAIRREELTMNVEAEAVQNDEFVCSSCFLVKRTSQLANNRKVLCRDCAA